MFDNNQGAWIADETLPRTFDTFSQSKQKLRSKQSRKIVKKDLCLSRHPNLAPSRLLFSLFLVNELTLRTDVTYMTKYGDI